MRKQLSKVRDLDVLRNALSRDMVGNSHFLSRVFGSRDAYEVFATRDNGAAMAIQSTRDHIIFTGAWDGIEIPAGLLPKNNVFVSASPPAAVDILKGSYALGGEWPCWYFLAPEGYGPGEWDALGPLRDDDVSFIAPFWELGGDDREEHIRHAVKKYDSACLRIDGKPVSWCGLHYYFEGVGNLGFAHTLAEHRRKGLQALVTKALVNKVHARGGRATSDVIKDNSASIATCKSLGFEVVGEQSWAELRWDG